MKVFHGPWKETHHSTSCLSAKPDDSGGKPRLHQVQQLAAGKGPGDRHLRTLLVGLLCVVVAAVLGVLFGHSVFYLRQLWDLRGESWCATAQGHTRPPRPQHSVGPFSCPVHSVLEAGAREGIRVLQSLNEGSRLGLSPPLQNEQALSTDVENLCLWRECKSHLGPCLPGFRCFPTS